MEAVKKTHPQDCDAVLRKLQETLRIFELAQKAAKIGLWWSDPEWEGKLVWTDEAYRIFGMRKADFDGRVETFFKLVHQDDFAYVTKASKDALAGQKPYDVVHRIVRPGGEVRWVHQQAEVIFGPDGTPRQMIGTVQDITERQEQEIRFRETEQKLLVRNEELENLNRILVGREIKMIELKGRIEKLEREHVDEKKKNGG